MKRQLIRLMLSAVVGVLALLAPPAANGWQVGVKAPPPANAPPKPNAPPTKPSKKPLPPKSAPPKSASIAPLTYSILSRIEKYKAPAFPKSAHIDRETYDYRMRSKAPVPATLTDVLICDIWQRVTMDLKLSANPKEPSEEIISKGMNVYLTKPWNDIAGYRPWTHWNFIRGLNEAERETLVKDVARYIAKNGVRDVKN